MKFHLELTAGRFIRKSIRQNLENTKKKLEFIINKGSKSQFLRTVDAVFK